MEIVVDVITEKSGNVTTKMKKIKFQIGVHMIQMTLAEASRLERNLHEAINRATFKDLEFK